MPGRPAFVDGDRLAAHAVFDSQLVAVLGRDLVLAETADGSESGAGDGGAGGHPANATRGGQPVRCCRVLEDAVSSPGNRMAETGRLA